MRKLLIIFIPFVLLAGVFTVYFLTQPKFGISTQDSHSSDQFSDTNLNQNQIIKPGFEAWSKKFDEQGELSYQFKCAYYEYQANGTVKVTAPVIQIFLSHDQMMQISGRDGVVQYTAGADKGMMNNSPSEPPRYGTLRNVLVQIFNSDDAQSEPLMTMTMASAQFDNDTFRLFTQEYVDENGKVWHENDIPVTVTAKDYSFNGSGLVLYWNDIDKRLKSLQIAHAEDLTLNDAGDLSPKGAGTSPASPSAGSAPPAVTTAPATQQSVAPVTAPQLVRQRYTATFYGDVQVFQGHDQIAAGDQMAVDFAAKAEDDSSPAQTAPQAANAASQPANSVAVNIPSQSSKSQTVATTQPTPQPIHIYWKGPMRMVPTDPATAEPLPDGKAIIRLVGAPAKVHQTSPASGQIVDASAGTIEYHTADSSARLRKEVTLKQTRPDGIASTVTGQDLEFSRERHRAVFRGPGITSMPDTNDPRSVLIAKWEKACIVRFYDLAGDQMQVEHAQLQGNVSVEHPRFSLSATNDLRLSFDAPTPTGKAAIMSRSAPGVAQNSGSPPLREILAEGDAKCVVHETKNQDRWIGGQTLRLIRDTGPDGKLYARQIICNGSAHAEQQDESISAGNIMFNLLPTTRKSDAAGSDDQLGGDVALDQLRATDGFIVTGKDDSQATGDSLLMQMVNEHPHVKIVGSADFPAQMKKKELSISGPVIRLDPHAQLANVDGPGSFNGIQESTSPNEKPRPLNLVWQQSASLDGNANQATILGHVVGDSDDAGTHQTMACDRVTVTLMDGPPATTKPTRHAGNDPISDDADFMRNKQIKLISLQTDGSSRAKVESVTRDALGNLIHQYDLWSRTIDIDPNGKQLNVNGPGDILAREQSPPTTQPSAATQPSGIGGSGQTAIDWKKQFNYDDLAHKATILGDITVVHTADGPRAQTVRLEHADTVQADFFAAATSRPGNQSGQPSEPKLKEMLAQGEMTIRTGGKTIYCGELDFDPVNQILDCKRGDKMRKVTVIDDSNLNAVTYDEASLDLKTNQLIRMTNVNGQGNSSIQN